MTLRSLFSMMPPTRHHHDPSQSEVLAHICQVLRCDLDRASRAFGSMRNMKSRVLVFDGQSRLWRGCDWVPSDVNNIVKELQNKILFMEKEIKYIKKCVSLKKRVRSKSKLKEEVAHLRCACQSYGFQQTSDKDVYKCYICGKTTTNNNLKIYNLWDINGNKVINGGGI